MIDTAASGAGCTLASPRRVGGFSRPESEASQAGSDESGGWSSIIFSRFINLTLQ
jgi:hypothetical protein